MPRIPEDPATASGSGTTRTHRTSFTGQSGIRTTLTRTMVSFPSLETDVQEPAQQLEEESSPIHDNDADNVIELHPVASTRQVNEEAREIADLVFYYRVWRRMEIPHIIGRIASIYWVYVSHSYLERFLSSEAVRFALAYDSYARTIRNTEEWGPRVRQALRDSSPEDFSGVIAYMATLRQAEADEERRRREQLIPFEY